jgi:alanyl-tRNA synthetase
MTNRLYYDDPHLRSFDASIVAIDRRGDQLIVTLDRSAFYPTSGGQPFDTGTIAGLRVVDVIDREDGTVAHVIERSAKASRSENTSRATELEREALAERMPVHGEIDWARRFDHMQQHTGQHVLSAAFEHLFHVRTVSFHLGADASTIDLAREVSAAEIAAAEDEANRIVWDDRPVAIRYASAEDAANLPLRKESKREGTLRLIDIADFDLSACGGTHVARTGAIGVIAVAGAERFKGGQRIEFLCGRRALDRFRALRDSVAAGVRLLSVTPAELSGSIERMQADAKEQKRTIVALQTEVARFRAAEIAASAENGVVLRAIDGDANTLKALASAIASKSGLAAVLVSTSRPALIVVARASDVGIDAQRVLAGLIERFGGRGGGKAELAQGGGLNGSSAEILNLARQLCKTSAQN